MIKHIKLWLEWAKGNRNSWPYKILVLLKLTKSPTFETLKMFSSIDWDKYTQK